MLAGHQWERTSTSHQKNVRMRSLPVARGANITSINQWRLQNNLNVRLHARLPDIPPLDIEIILYIIAISLSIKPSREWGPAYAGKET
jgi:hypothetical protein